MPTTEESVLIDRDQKEVWDFLADPDNATLYQSNLAEYEQVSEGPTDVGTRTRGVTKLAGKRIEWSAEVTTWEPPNRVSVRSLESPIQFEFGYTVEQVGDATKVTSRLEAPTLGGFFGKLADPLVTKMYARDVRGNLENLKEILESGAT